MNNLAERREYWNRRGSRGPYNHHDEHDSLPYPFEAAGLTPIFSGKDVLEIGPGNGRQYERVYFLSRSYCIADISPAGLAEPVFKHANAKFLIDSWLWSTERRFDIVHFWYVLHHICHAELAEFFACIARHLRPGGLTAFNTPQLINVQGAEEGDGIGTTWVDPVGIQKVLPASLEILLMLNVDHASTGFIFLLRKEVADGYIP